MRALFIFIAGCSPLIDTGEAPSEDTGPPRVDVGGPRPDGYLPIGGPDDAGARLDMRANDPDGAAARLDRGLPPRPDGGVPRPDGRVDAARAPDVGVRVERLGTIGAAEPFDDTGTQGGPPGPFFYGECDDEADLLVGVDAKLDEPDVVSALRPRCAQLEVWRKDGVLVVQPQPTRVGPWLGDEDAGGDQSFECPPGMVISDYGGGATIVLSGLYLGCAPLFVEPDGDGVRVSRGEMVDFGELGEPDAANYIGADCPPSMGAVALMVDLNPIGLSSFTRFGLECGTPTFWRD